MASKERRQNRRHELRHDVLVVARGLNPVACELGNICESGMWLSHLGSPSLLEQLRDHPDAALEIHLFVAHAAGEVHERVMARMRRMDGSSIGVQFREPRPDLLTLLTQTGVRERRVVVANEAQRHQLWRIFRDYIPTLVYPMLGTFIEFALESIERRLSQSGLLREINELKDSRTILTTGHATLARNFMSRLQAPVAEMDGKSPARSQREDLSVVDKAQFEDWLELQMVATDVSNRHRNTLFRLNQLLSQLALKDLDNRSNPVAPMRLCHCLQYTVFQANISAPVRSILYHAFESALAEHWPAATDALIQQLMEAGLRVLDLDSMPFNWSPPEPPKSDETNENKPTPASEPEGQLRHSSDVQRLAQGSLLRLVGLKHDPRPTGEPVTEDYALVAKQLQSLRSDLRLALSGDSPSIQQALEHAAEQNQELKESLDQDAWDRVGLVDKLFAPLARQERLPDTLREHLDQLRVPVLQVLLEQPGFLDEESHPAREVVNNLMRLCLADRSSSKMLERTVSEVVDQLLEADELDDALFQQVGQRLRELVERQEQSFGRNAERIAKTLDGQQRLKQTRQAVRKRINARLAGQDIPTILLDLLEVGWDQLLVLSVLKEGCDSRAFVELFSVVEQIQNWLGRDGDSQDLAFERELESTAILQLVERELMTVADPPRGRDVIKRLHSQLLDEAKPEHVRVASYPPGEPPPEPAPVREPDGSRWAERAHQLEVGDWVDVRQSDGESQRMRLVWGGEDVYRFVFLTAQGLHEVEYDLTELIGCFQSGEVRRVQSEQVPFVDQSLFDIVQDVYREMAFRATHDPLTGCVHRHEFEKQLARLMSQCRSGEQEGALVSFDIDQFGVINASYGTGAGDAMLREFGVLLSELQRQDVDTSILGRLGGNEFGLAMLPLSLDESVDFAEQLRQRFRQHTFRHQDAEFQSTISISVNAFNQNSPETGELFNQSNLALKSAKKAGGDRIEVVGERQHQSQKMMSWVSRIDSALEGDSLSLRAQRITPISESGDGVFFEILLGLQDASGQYISPQSFVEAAEQSRRSTRVDRWVVDKTFAWMQQHPDVVASLGGLNINLSGASLSDDAFLSYLEAVVRRGLVPAEKLCFEVTETAAIANLRWAADFMQELKRLGCRFALDDFGTGLASYAYLQQLPVDFVKIDGIFVRGLDQNLTNYAMVRSINELSHFLGIRTIAEYVEDMETLDALREINVDYAQGFGISKPRPLESLKPEKVPVPAQFELRT